MAEKEHRRRVLRTVGKALVKSMGGMACDATGKESSALLACRRAMASATATEGDFSPGTIVTAPPKAMSRRRVLKSAAGVAAVGAAGATLWSTALAPPASAQTTTASGGMAPTVVALTDVATIVVDASLGNDFRVTLGGDRTMGNPANPTDGQQIIFQITQGAAGWYTITWASSYEFSTGLPQPALSTIGGQTDVLGFIYNAAHSSWLLAAFVNGFS